MPADSLNRLLTSRTGLLTGYVIAVALLAYVLIDIYQRYQFSRQIEDRITIAEHQIGQGQPRAGKATLDTRQLASLHIFGRSTQTKPLSAKPVTAPATRLKLRLIGIIADDEGRLSRAIVNIDNKNTAVYAVGDALPMGNAKVHRILPDRILLMRNGKLESLAIDRPVLRNRNGELVDDGKRKKGNVRIDEKILVLPAQPDPLDKATAPTTSSPGR